MPAGAKALTTRPTWEAPEVHHKGIRHPHPARAFRGRSACGERVMAGAAGKYFHRGYLPSSVRKSRGARLHYGRVS